MNDAIRPRGELKMTVICKSCEHQYGAWRPRCPACGTHAPSCKHGLPRGVCAVCLGSVRATPQPNSSPRKARQPRTSSSQCAFCRVRGAKQRCPICNELVHGTCMTLHQPECEQYQRDVAMEAARLAKEAS